MEDVNVGSKTERDRLNGKAAERTYESYIYVKESEVDEFISDFEKRNTSPRVASMYINRESRQEVALEAFDHSNKVIESILITIVPDKPNPPEDRFLKEGEQPKNEKEPEEKTAEEKFIISTVIKELKDGGPLRQFLRGIF